MKTILRAIAAEVLKLKRSRIFLVTVGLYIFIPIMMGLLMYLAQHPEIAQKMGIVGAKSQFFTENNWDGFFEILEQLMAVLGVIGFGFITSWMFGKEYIEGTLTDILSLPVGRGHIVLAKHIVLWVWCIFLILCFVGSSIVVGVIGEIPDWNRIRFIKFIRIIFISGAYIILLNPFISFVASISKGIIAPIGFILFMVILAQFAAVVGFGPYFPWAIPGVYATQESNTGLSVVPLSIYILFFTFIFGLLSTLFWWIKTDQH